MQKIIPYLINIDDIIPARSKATLLNEIAIALNELINIYGKKMSKMGKISRICTCFWPVRLIPLNETRACVCSYLLNKQEKLRVGKFKQYPANPANVITGADAESFLDSLDSYNSNYLRKSKYFKRGKVIQEALFSTSEIGYFRNFFLNNYDLSVFKEPFFILDGDPIAKSVNQIKIIPEIYDFVNLKDVKMLDEYADKITELCERWVKKGTKKADKIRGTTIDTSQEEKQLAMLNRELQEEKERDLEASPEDLVKSGKYKINDKTAEFNNGLNALRNSVDRIRQAIAKKDLFLLEEGIKDLDLRYTDLGNSISRYKTEISQLKKNLAKEEADAQAMQKKKIQELERKITEVEKQIDNKHQDLTEEIAEHEDTVVQIKEMKQEMLQNIESVKDSELTDLQEFFNNYSIEIQTDNIVIGIPIFVFFFVDQSTGKTETRAPVLPVLIEKGKIVRTKVKSDFRDKLEDLMNKYTPMINLVETEGQKANLMDTIKNLDTQLEDAINDLRIKKLIGKKDASKARDIINQIIW